MEPKGVISDMVGRIVAQFSFPHQRRIPSWLYEEERETARERKNRKRKRPVVVPVPVAPGAAPATPTVAIPEERFIEPTMRVSLSELPDDIRTAGFVLTDAFAKPRRDAKNHGRTYYMCRFVFARSLPANTTAFWRNHLETNLTDAFTELCVPCWRVRAYEQKGHAEGGKVRKGTINLNMEVCIDNLPRERWEHLLRIDDGMVRLVPLRTEELAA